MNNYDVIPSYVFGNCILDIGAANGMEQLNSKHRYSILRSHYHGIDIRAKSLDIKLNIQLNIQFGDIITWETDQTWDTVLLVAVMEHISFFYWERLFAKLRSFVTSGGYMVVVVPWDEKLDKYITSKDYNYHKKHYTLDSISHCHEVFHITPKILRFMLPDCYIIKQHYRVRFREDGESLGRAILRFIKRFFTFHPYVWNRLLLKKELLIAVWRNE